MWLATRYGFFSIVRKEWNGKMRYLVRARGVQDLYDLCARCGWNRRRVKHSTDSDYPCRLVLKDEDYEFMMVRLAKSVNYDNFKSMVQASPSQSDKHGHYHDVWQTMVDWSHGVKSRWDRMWPDREPEAWEQRTHTAWRDQ